MCGHMAAGQLNGHPYGFEISGFRSFLPGRRILAMVPWKYLSRTAGNMPSPLDQKSVMLAKTIESATMHKYIIIL